MSCCKINLSAFTGNFESMVDKPEHIEYSFSVGVVGGGGGLVNFVKMHWMW